MRQKKIKPKYSEMLLKLVKQFDEQFPKNMSFEDTLEVGISAWNLANKKEFLDSNNLYEQEIEGLKNYSIIKKMVEYKIKHYDEYHNEIIDYETTDNILKLKTQNKKILLDNFIKHILENIKKENEKTE